ncbi:GNAT family N-acetyltransferase [Bacillus cereus]|uniref:GNAT family N-acetyltransferase n=1 Tax=Bacillus cereus TaxID=1396 RepID=UPI002111F462|nr:GNAT family N-acetyltransferase [Bacillus cereus]HDR4949052.1 GNAT family N-acetyltransferase [Bacillus cereus]
MICDKLQENNLLIRKIKKSDIESIRKWRNQDHIRKYFINNTYINEVQQLEWFKKYSHKDDDIMFMVEETLEFQTVIGTVALYNINKSENSAEFGRLMIGHLPAMGKGFGKRTAILASKYAFEILDISKIYLNVLSYNVKAIQLYKKIGFIIKSTSPHEIKMVLSKKDFLSQF